MRMIVPHARLPSTVDSRCLQERRFPALRQIRSCLKAEEMRFGSEAAEAMVCAF